MGRTARRGVARTVALASAACGSRVRNPALCGFVGPVAGGVARIAHGVGMRVARRGENRAGYGMAAGAVGGGRLLDLGAHEGRVGDERVSCVVDRNAQGLAGGERDERVARVGIAAAAGGALVGRTVGGRRIRRAVGRGRARGAV